MRKRKVGAADIILALRTKVLAARLMITLE